MEQFKQVDLQFKDNNYVISCPEVIMKVKDLLSILEELDTEHEVVLNGVMKIPVKMKMP